MARKSAYISLVIITIFGSAMAIINTLWSRFLLEFCYIAMGWWLGYAMAGGFDGRR